jgi:hypothetical protein
MSQAEDVFFAEALGGRVLRAAEPGSFSVEQVMDTDALGYHQFWRYHAVEETTAHFERLLCA